MPILTFKAGEDEAIIIRRKARAMHMTLSAFARYALLNAPTELPESKKNDRITPGRSVVATPPLSREMLDAVIYEY